MKPELTKHAEKRWRLRFPDRNLEQEWAGAYRNRGQRVGDSTLKLIRKRCPVHRRFVSQNFRGYYYLMSKHRIVFVCAPPRIVITMFELPELCPKKSP